MEQIIYIKMDLALNNLQRLICHKTQQTNMKMVTALFLPENVKRRKKNTTKNIKKTSFYKVRKK